MFIDNSNDHKNLDESMALFEPDHGRSESTFSLSDFEPNSMVRRYSVIGKEH